MRRSEEIINPGIKSLIIHRVLNNCVNISGMTLIWKSTKVSATILTIVLFQLALLCHAFPSAAIAETILHCRGSQTLFNFTDGVSGQTPGPEMNDSFILDDSKKVIYSSDHEMFADVCKNWSSISIECQSTSTRQTALGLSQNSISISIDRVSGRIVIIQDDVYGGGRMRMGTRAEGTCEKGDPKF